MEGSGVPSRRDVAEAVVRDARKGRQVVAPALQHSADRADAMGTEVFIQSARMRTSRAGRTALVSA